jgi:DinB family protein
MDMRYPIGRFARPDEVDAAARTTAVSRLDAHPRALRAAVAGLTPAQLDTPYRDGGWTVRQVVHHLPDSHLNAYVRFKLALTEEEPTVRPFDEAEWAKLPDVAGTPVDTSLALTESLHTRWVTILRAMGPAEWRRTLRHPESGIWRLEQFVLLYAWHGDHHAAHITNLRTRMGW